MTPTLQLRVKVQPRGNHYDVLAVHTDGDTKVGTCTGSIGKIHMLEKELLSMGEKVPEITDIIGCATLNQTDTAHLRDYAQEQGVPFTQEPPSVSHIGLCHPFPSKP